MLCLWTRLGDGAWNLDLGFLIFGNSLETRHFRFKNITFPPCGIRTDILHFRLKKIILSSGNDVIPKNPSTNENKSSRPKVTHSL